MLNFLTGRTSTTQRGKYLQRKLNHLNYILAQKKEHDTNIKFEFTVSNLIKIELALFFAKKLNLKFTPLQITQLLNSQDFKLPCQKDKKSLYSCLYPTNLQLQVNTKTATHLSSNKQKNTDITIMTSNYVIQEKVNFNILSIVNDLSLTIDNLQLCLNQKTKIPLYLIEKPLQLQKFYFIWQNQYIPPGDINLSTKETIYNFLPKPYANYFKHTLTYKGTLHGLYKFIGSKKKAKKYLRIIHKRLKLYTQKKVPWRSKLKYF